MTAITVTTASPSNSTDAYFRGWCSAISASLESLGIIKTADTGQINLATVARPTAGGEVKGYEIRRFSDALQATAPVFLKIEYGASSSNANCIGIWITVGTGSDGAGNLTGTTTTRTHLSGNTTSSTTAYPCKFQGGTNRFSFYTFYGLTQNTVILSVERYHDNTGADTADGVLVLMYGFVQGAIAQALTFSGSVVSNHAHWNVTAPLSGTGAVGADIYMYPIRGWNPFETSASMNIFCYFNADLTVDVNAPCTSWWGPSITVWPSSLSVATMYYGGAVAFAMRFD